ncbi:LTA synthase family protein [Pontibacter silvestris]|uniref:LTA synthase family protein n=1 Tax=Pontibacter silvestris TaxID=2305183 RepID=A0ABW4X054_9BACT|nr:alkaline phosphatase family protein [Pontibacter silvestris]MCC9138250.1 sulfatase-like hydrolase/transferase [Pontibacter silvestris]
MKKRLYFHPLYFLFWVLYFIVARAIFLLYHLDRTQQLSSSDVSLVFFHGLHLDLSFAAYLSLLPFVASVVSALWKGFNANAFVRYYTNFFVVFIAVLLSVDLELYSFWGFRLDATPIQYLNTPGEMLASAAAAPIMLLLCISIAMSVAFILLYHRYFDLRLFSLINNKWLVAGVALFFAALLVVPLRGGIQQIPINQSVVYFSENPYANHAGLNMPWNLMHSLLKYNKQSKNPYQYMAKEEAAERVQALYAPSPDSALQVVSNQKPNVLFIILESYTAKFVESLGGEKGVTPNLNKLAAEGISFTNMYASGDRSEKGMVALLSGYPVQTITSIIKTPKKTEKLPHLSQVFEQQGYRTSYYYGGELEFANIKSYLLNGGYDHLIDKYDFPSSSYNSKWGAHDHILFERVLQDLQKEKEPFFTTVYTLSSHEPFEIPIAPKFPGTDNEALFRNSVYYTDWALGRFVVEAKNRPWWQNTLVVIVADHGHPLPGNDANYQTSKFRIPFILTGGAVEARGLKINTIGSQTDIATTLLTQLNLPHQNFKWGRNLLAPVSHPFAFYVFNDGFGYVTEQGELTIDNVSKTPITRDPEVTEDQLKNGEAYMQYSFEDFLQK